MVFPLFNSDSRSDVRNTPQSGQSAADGNGRSSVNNINIDTSGSKKSNANVNVEFTDHDAIREGAAIARAALESAERGNQITAAGLLTALERNDAANERGLKALAESNNLGLQHLTNFARQATTDDNTEILADTQRTVRWLIVTVAGAVVSWAAVGFMREAFK